MTGQRLQNRLAQLEGRASPHRYVVYIEDGESVDDAHMRAAGLGRPIVLMPRPIADAAECVRTCGPCDA